MNNSKRIPIGTNNVRAWPFVGLAALILALIAGTGIVAVTNRSTSNGARLPAVRQPLPAFDLPAANLPRPLLTYYLVDSAELGALADQLEAETQMAIMANDGMSERRHFVYQITTPEEDLNVAAIIGTTSYELALGGVWDFAVVDLRQPN
jgi:hypothetical protein